MAMVLTEEQVKAQVRRFMSYVGGRVPVTQWILFGSYARGSPRAWSDVDLAVISPAWAEYSRQERMAMLARWAWEAGTPWVEAVGYTPEELRHAAPGSFVGDVRDTGIVLQHDAEGADFGL